MSCMQFCRCFLRYLLLVVGFSWAVVASVAQDQSSGSNSGSGNSNYAARSDVQAWVQDLSKRQGINADWITEQLGRARFLPQVPRLMTPASASAAATTAPDWRTYRSRFIDATRIRAGVEFWNANEVTLRRAEQIYGVPPAIVVGIIGVETLYGQHMGNLRVLDSLATLAFDFPSAHPRAQQRQDYFRGELEQFLLSAWRSGQDPSLARGSYAGATGLAQFMPTSLAKWGVDFDGDGRIDLFGSTADAIGSVASYFQAHGWRSGEAVWYTPLFNPEGLELERLLEPDILPSFTAQEMLKMGVMAQGGLEHKGKLALVELKNGVNPPSYIVGTQNFYTITRYNWSSYYALTVYDLGQEVAAARYGTAAGVAQPVELPDKIQDR